MWKQLLWINALLLGCGSGIFSAEDVEKSDAAPTAEAGALSDMEEYPELPPEQELRGEGRFLLWYYPERVLLESRDGHQWDPVGTNIEEMLWSLTGDADGRLYASVAGVAPSVITSLDGEQWESVPTENSTTRAIGATVRKYAICGGATDQVFALASDGAFFRSNDAGKSWTSLPSPMGENPPLGTAFRGHCSVAPQPINVEFGAEPPDPLLGAWVGQTDTIVVQAWFGRAANASGAAGGQPVSVFSITKDGGATWKSMEPPYERNLADGVGFTTKGIFYAAEDQRGHVTMDEGESWGTSVPAPLANQESGNPGWHRLFATDGGEVVVGLVPAEFDGKSGFFMGNVFYSQDQGATFLLTPLPWSEEPTPAIDDTFMALTYVP